MWTYRGIGSTPLCLGLDSISMAPKTLGEALGLICPSSCDVRRHTRAVTWFGRRRTRSTFFWPYSLSISSIGGQGRPTNIWRQGREHRGELCSAGDPGHRDEGAATVHQRVQDSSQLDQLTVPVEGNGYPDDHRRQGEQGLFWTGRWSAVLFSCFALFCLNVSDLFMSNKGNGRAFVMVMDA